MTYQRSPPNQHHPGQDGNHRPECSFILYDKFRYIFTCHCKQNKTSINTAQHVPTKFGTNKSASNKKEQGAAYANLTSQMTTTESIGLQEKMYPGYSLASQIPNVKNWVVNKWVK